MRQSVLSTWLGARLLRRYIGRPFLVANEWLWSRLSPSITTSDPMRRYGAFLHSLVKLRSTPCQRHGTFFFRNRPELELLRRLIKDKPKNAMIQIAVLACSNGAEVYSMLWALRSARPDLKIITHAIDISNDVLEIGRNGLYSQEPNHLVNSSVFERMSRKEMDEMFDREIDHLRVKQWIKENITWQVADAGDLQLANRLGKQDIVVANRFLCHMASRDAEKCLRNLNTLVKPEGYLFVSGVDLDIRTKVALDLGWIPVLELIEEIHNGDCSVRRDWPWRYWGLEPFNRKRHDWDVRYASVFKVGSRSSLYYSSITELVNS
jgi:SAM-dependent methyltransferase